MKKYPQTHSTARENQTAGNRTLHKNLLKIPKFYISVINVKIFKVSLFGLRVHHYRRKH